MLVCSMVLYSYVVNLVASGEEHLYDFFCPALAGPDQSYMTVSTQIYPAQDPPAVQVSYDISLLLLLYSL